jgi:hypothetical protein
VEVIGINSLRPLNKVCLYATHISMKLTISTAEINRNTTITTGPEALLVMKVTAGVIPQSLQLQAQVTLASLG